MPEQKVEQADGEELARVPSPARDADALLGESYRRIRRIGSGGMADVYEVEHLRLEARFAAKVMRPGGGDEEITKRRFLREARLLARLRSEHIVQVFDVSEDAAEQPFYVMELLDGVDLRQLMLRNERLSLERAARIVCDACAGLAVVHAARLVHRDLKPENLFITHRDGGEDLCKLLDFGVSKGSGAPTTEAGDLVGTISYMPPEQVDSAGTVTARSDVYALGAILYELLAGRPPHVADSVERLLFSILTAEPVPLAELRPDAPAELCEVVHKALSADPKERFATAEELAAALRRFARREESGATLFTPGGAARVRAGRRSPWRTRSAAIVLLAGVGLAGVVLIRSLRDDATHERSDSPVKVIATPPAPPRPAAIAEELTARTPALEAPAAPRRAASPTGLPEPPPVRHATAPRQSAISPPRAAHAAVSTSKPEDGMDAGAPLPRIHFVLANPYEH